MELDYFRLSFEWVSISFLVMISKPRICVHSETMFPTTCPHLEVGFDRANVITHPAPVIRRNRVKECCWSSFQIGRRKRCGGFRLSAEPTSYMYLVAITVTTRPVQSAMALPKNDPQWVLGFEWIYSRIQKSRTIPAVM